MRVILTFVNSHRRSNAEPRKRPAQDRSRHTVAAILDAAARIFAERGYTSTTTNHVAEAAGISIGSLYQYFPNKDALIVALEERHLHDARAALSVAITGWRIRLPDPHEWARSLVDVLITVNGSPLHVLVYDTAPPLPRLTEQTDEIVDELAAETGRHLRRWGHRGGVDIRARVIVITALRLVHDLAIRTPPGSRRDRVRREIIRMIAVACAP